MALDAQRLFRSINLYARQHGFTAGFPAFFEAWSNGKQVFGAYFLESAERCWLGGDFLKDVETPGDLFQAADEAARIFGYGMGFPTYTQVETDQGIQQEAVFLDPSQTEFRLLDAAQLGIGLEDPLAGKIKKVQAYARAQGYRSGLPCGNELRENGKIAVQLFQTEAVTWKVLSEAELEC